MSNINKRLSELSPYVLGIRFTNGISVVDTTFKQGWTLPKSDIIGVEEVPSRADTYMLYPQNENVVIDEMLDYVAYVIRVNIEREQKIELLQVKINELKHIFTKSSLEKCQTLKFKFSDLLTPSVEDEEKESIDLPIMTGENTTVVGASNTATGEHSSSGPDNVITEEDLSSVPIAEAPQNDADVQRFNQQARVNNETFDLPPKKDGKIVVETFDEPEVICKCDPNDPNQVCPKCIEY